MSFPKLTPLQSRFAATFGATIFVLAFYYIFSTNSGSFAYALDEVDQLVTVRSSYAVVFDEKIDGDDDDNKEEEEEKTAEEGIIRRADIDPTAIGNNQFQLSNIELGQTEYWVFPKDAVLGTPSPMPEGLPANITVMNLSSEDDDDRVLPVDENLQELKKRSNTVYISLNTCLKPSLNTNNSQATTTTTTTVLPPLTVYVSTSSNNKNPGPDGNPSLQTNYTAHEGYMGTTIENADGDIYISVSAPNTTLFTGIYNYQVAASIDAYFHSIDNDTNLFFIDSDINSALLITNNLTQSQAGSPNYQQWMNLTPPFTIFANNINNTDISGLEKSYCALSQLAQMRQGNNAINKSMTSRGLGNKPKEQFYVTYLNSSSTYYGILGMEGNSTASGNGVIGGGGKVWKAMNFTTKADDNCALLYNLDFCSEVAYAVPSNPKINSSALASIYDQNAQTYYQQFNYSLSLIQCNTSSTGMYSLAVGCNDCAQSYKQWLCAVTIPRCYDWSSNYSFLQPRNAGQAFLNGTTLPATDPLVQSPVSNASRNPIIDSEIEPGPYKEILPCTDLCYDLVRTCPAALGFMCPSGQYLNDSYGYRAANGDITCSYLGAAYYLNGALGLFVPSVGMGLLLTGLWVVMFLVV